MSEGGIEHSAVAPELRPRDRHVHRFVRDVIIAHEREAGRRQHLDRRVDMEIVVLRIIVLSLTSVELFLARDFKRLLTLSGFLLTPVNCGNFCIANILNI